MVVVRVSTLMHPVSAFSISFCCRVIITLTYNKHQLHNLRAAATEPRRYDNLLLITLVLLYSFLKSKLWERLRLWQINYGKIRNGQVHHLVKIGKDWGLSVDGSKHLNGHVHAQLLTPGTCSRSVHTSFWSRSAVDTGTQIGGMRMSTHRLRGLPLMIKLMSHAP